MGTEADYGRVRESFFEYGGNFNFRRGSFKRWPYQREDNICHPIYMSLEWWRSSGDSDVHCVICQKELEGWEEHDHPFLEHKKHSKSCPVVIAHTFLDSLPEETVGQIQSGEQLKEAYIKWVKDIEPLSPPQSVPSSPEAAPVTAMKGKRGRAAKKGTALKTMTSAKNLAELLESAVSPDALTQTQRKQPRRQVKTTLTKSGISAPNLITAVKKPIAQPKTKPVISYDELCLRLENLFDKVTEKHLVKELLDDVRAAGSILN